MTSESMNVVEELVGDAVVVAPDGNVDLLRSPRLRESLRAAQMGAPIRLIVDLTRVRYMDSSGVATLVEALGTARRTGTRLVLCGMGEQVRSVLRIARLEGVFTIVSTREEALRA